MDIGLTFSIFHFFSYPAQAEIQHDMLRMELSSFKPREPLSASDLMYSTLDYIPPALRQEIYMTFYIGFFTIFDAIAYVLKTPGISTPQAVMAAALELNARAVQFYLAKGGKVEYVLDATVDIAREQSSLGDGTFEETFDCDEGPGDSKEDDGELRYRELGVCGNDLEFGIVRRGLGIGPGAGAGVRWGPYYEGMDVEEGMDVDEYDSDSD